MRAPYEVRCPLHGSIAFDDRERAVIDHPLVQRLRYISQLGFAALVYPGATHSRFSHSLGVMHLAGRIFDRIAAASPDLSRAGYGPDELAYCRGVVRLAGLLHDLGHPPFSHSFEPLLPARSALALPWHAYAHGGDEREARATHEDFSVAAVWALAGGEGALLSPQEAQDICALIDGRIAPGPALSGEGQGRRPIYPLLKQIISGEIDADRMDYLRRDAHFAGVTYGLFDLPRLIQALAGAEVHHGLVMTLEHNALYTYENFLMARFHMAMQVYFHKTLLPFEHFLKCAVEEGEIDFRMDGSLDNFLEAREDRVLDALYRARKRRWSGRIIHRRPMARLLQLEELPDAPRRRRVLEAVEALRGQGVEVIHLREERPLSTLGRPGSESAFPIHVERSMLGRTWHQPLHEVSVLLERYNQVFTIESLYCDPTDYERAAASLGPILDETTGPC